MNFFKHVHIFLIVVTKHDYSFTKESHWHIVNFKACGVNTGEFDACERV